MIIVTGGAGFIGINFVKYLLSKTDEKIFVIDNLTYASNYEELWGYNVGIAKIDIADKDSINEFFKRHDNISSIIHFAAESHVDKSIDSCMPFVYSNIIGTINLLDAAREYKIPKFIQISTDEVFGSIETGHFNEQSQIQPRNPYSASKASAEHFVQAYGNTYGLNYIIINSSNNYGPWQNSEKLIPKTIECILNNRKIPLYGDGKQIRDWIYVEDTCDAIYKIYCDGVIGERYCIGSGSEYRNIDLVKMICDKMNYDLSNIEFVADRPGHDVRYSTDISKLKKLGWERKTLIYDGLNKTIDWMKTK